MTAEKPALRPLEEILIQEPYRFEFSQAVRLLHCFNPSAVPLGTSIDPQKEVAFFKSRIFLSAPPSDLYRIRLLSKFKPSRRSWPLAHRQLLLWHTPPSLPLLTYQGPWVRGKVIKTPHREGKSALEVQVNFLGIAGVQGPLPIAYTEMICDRLRSKDAVTRDFLDLFNHRLLSLFYRIEQKSNPALQNVTPEKTPFGKALVSLIGVGSSPAFDTRALLNYTRFFWKKPHTSESLKTILQDYFGHPVKILDFQGRWFHLERDQRTCLRVINPQNTCLGHTAVLGRRVWAQDQGIGVCLTIKTPEEFLDFLPTGSFFNVLKQLTCCYVGARYHIRLGLKLIQKPPSQLGEKTPFPFRLGWTSWLLQKPSCDDAGWIRVTDPEESAQRNLFYG